MSRLIKSALALSAALSLFAAATATARDLAQEERNRALVVKFYDGVFNRHEVEKSAEVLADDYRQHNPWVANGKKAFVDIFRDSFKKNAERRARIVRSAADGDLVWLHIHSTDNAQDRGRASVDIFRVENGKIAEHWDVIQAVPEKSANDNTMF